jgi:hypothetical protein
VIDVVQADADKLADVADARTDARFALHERQRRWIEGAQTSKSGLRQHVTSDVGNDIR